MTGKKPTDGKNRAIFWIGLVIFVISAVAVGGVILTLHGRSTPAPPPVAVRLKVPPMPPTRPETNPEIVTDQQELPPEPETAASEPDEAGSQEMSSFEKAEDKDLETQPAQSNKNDESVNLSARASSTSELVFPHPLSPQESQKAGNISTDAQVQSQLAVQPEPQKADPIAPPNDGATIAKPVTIAPFTLQAGAFLTKTYADKKMAELIAKGYDAYIFETTDNQKRRWFAVRLGHFENREQAIAFLNQFKIKEKMTAIIANSKAR